MAKETEPGDARKIVEELFQSAVDLAPEEREAFLREHCDSSVLKRVVKLLELHDRADSLVADSPEKFESISAMKVYYRKRYKNPKLGASAYSGNTS